MERPARLTDWPKRVAGGVGSEAASMPSGIPTSRARTIEITASSRVTGSEWSVRSSTLAAPARSSRGCR